MFRHAFCRKYAEIMSSENKAGFRLTEIIVKNDYSHEYYFTEENYAQCNEGISLCHAAGNI